MHQCNTPAKCVAVFSMRMSVNYLIIEYSYISISFVFLVIDDTKLRYVDACPSIIFCVDILILAAEMAR
jgi:hypothetical protein